MTSSHHWPKQIQSTPWSPRSTVIIYKKIRVLSSIITWAWRNTYRKSRRVFNQLRNISKMRSVLSFSNRENDLLIYPPVSITSTPCSLAWIMELWSSSKLFRIQQLDYWLLIITHHTNFSFTAWHSVYFTIHSTKVLLTTCRTVKDLAPGVFNRSSSSQRTVQTKVWLESRLKTKGEGAFAVLPPRLCGYCLESAL